MTYITSTSESTGKINVNTFYINNDTIRRRRCQFISKVMTSGTYNDYAFESTELAFIRGGSVRYVKTGEALSEGQVLSLLYMLMIKGYELIDIKHVTSGEGYFYSMGLSGMDGRMNGALFHSPEDNGWVLEKIIKEHNKCSEYSSMYRLSIGEANIKEVVTLLDRVEAVVAVTEAEGLGTDVSIIDCEGFAIAYMSGDIVLVGSDEGYTLREVIRKLCKMYSIDKKDVGVIVEI